jgi:hypothetical protein
MHIEFLVEDQSGAKLLEALVPKIIGRQDVSRTWRIHPYGGVGRLPKGLSAQKNLAGRMLLNNLPRLLAGYGRTSGVALVVVVIDTDSRDCRDFLAELNGVLAQCKSPPRTLFRLAIEETEAWYLGDRNALAAAYPTAKLKTLSGYVQDSVCGTWEKLADALVLGGSKGLKKTGWPAPGQAKFEWAERVGPHMNVEENTSPSFVKLRDGLRREVSRLSSDGSMMAR